MSDYYAASVTDTDGTTHLGVYSTVNAAIGVVLAELHARCCESNGLNMMHFSTRSFRLSDEGHDWLFEVEPIGSGIGGRVEALTD